MTSSEFVKLTPLQKEAGVFIRGDKNNGIFCRWYPNDQINVKCTFVNGERHGEYISYYSNGQIERKCTYVNGKRHGEYIRYWDNGQIWKHYIYDDGEVIKDLLEEE